MDLLTYQGLALRTAHPRGLTREYLVPMIVGETGELFGQIAKGHWHGWTPEALQYELVSEYGDIAWGAAMLLHIEGVTQVSPQQPHSFPNTWGQPLTGIGELLQKANNLHTYYGEAPDLTQHMRMEAARLWLTLGARCFEVTGTPFETVLLRNIDKLADRAARKVLQGSGDHR